MGNNCCTPNKDLLKDINPLSKESSMNLKSTTFTDYESLNTRKVHVFLDHLDKGQEIKRAFSKKYVPILPDSYENIAKNCVVVLVGQALQKDDKSESLLIPNHLVMRAESAIRVYNGIKTKFGIDVPVLCSGGDYTNCGLTESEILHSLVKGNITDIFKKQKHDFTISKDNHEWSLVQQN